MMRWHIQHDTHVGGREEQQDRLLVVSSDDNQQQLLVVADGAGGHELGGQAAEAAINTVREQSDSLFDSDDLFADLDACCRLAHQQVSRVAGDGVAGTTIVMLLLRGTDAYWAHVGDSKLHVVRNQQCALSTKDHSLVQLYEDQLAADNNDRSLSSESPPPSNQLYMCLGVPGDIEPELSACKVYDGDVFLLSSDGFWGQIDLEDVFAATGDMVTRSDWASAWVHRAYHAQHSSSDNISLVAVCCQCDPPFSSGSLLSALKQRVQSWFS